jgi:hypothetical protein
MIKIREALDRVKELKDIEEFFEVLFEDDICLDLTGPDILLMSYVFKLLDESIYDLPYSSKYCPVNFYVGDAPSSNTVNEAFSEIMLDIIHEIGISNPDMHEIMMVHNRIMFDIINDIYNDLSEEFGEYIYGFGTIDILEISRNPKVMDIKEKLGDSPDYKDIKHAYDEITKVIYSDEISHSNGLKKLFVTQIGKQAQILQLIGLRGYCAEIDSTIFKYPVTNSFSNGMNSLYDIGVESRTAAFSLVSSTDSIKKSETFSRKLQLAGVYLERLYPGDCGTDEYLEWEVKPKTDEYQGDLKNLVGSYYKISHAEKEWSVIKRYDTHLIGKTIMLRNPTKCKLSDKHGVCATCFGELSFNIPYNANVGQLTSTTMSQAASQALLSTKHHVGSAGTNSVLLDEGTDRIFYEKQGVFYIHQSLNKTYDQIDLIFDVSDIESILSVKTTAMLAKIDVTKLTSIKSIDVLLRTGETYEAVVCPIRFNGRNGSLTKKLVQNCVKGNYELVNNKLYITVTPDIVKSGIIELENKNFSFYEFVKELENLIEKRTILKGGVARMSIDDLIKEVFYLVNKKLSINIANLSSMLYTYMTKDLPEGNFDLGRNYTSKRPEIVSLANSINNRSASASFLYDGGSKKIASADLFKTENKPSHIYDVLFYPEQRIKEFNAREKYYNNYRDKLRK